MKGRRFINLTGWDQWQHHNYFRDRKTGYIAIADDSGKYPDETDDGILYVDFTRKLKVSHKPTYRRGWCYAIPLITPDGKKCQTTGDDREAVWLKKQGIAGKLKPESIRLVNQGVV